MGNNTLHYETVTGPLKEALITLMNEPAFEPFRLVGGTNLSLRLGHRKSVDIDLFTDTQYDSLDFRVFERFMKTRFPYYDNGDPTSIVGFGRGYYIGNSKEDCIKLDLMYTDPFIKEAEVIDGIRMASMDDIVAMKINAISRGGRKKDFWDIHRLLDLYHLTEMLALHEKRHPWEHEEKQVLESLVDFNEADKWEDPICLMGKDWDEIKLDFIDLISQRSFL